MIGPEAAGPTTVAGPASALARAERRAPLVLLGVQVAAGPLVGLVWWALTHDPAPWVAGEPFLTHGSVDAARDGTLAVLGGMMGVAAGVRVLRRPTSRPLRMLVLGVAGAALGAALAVAVAAALPVGIDGERVVPRAWGAALVWPLALLAGVLAATGWSALADWVRGD